MPRILTYTKIATMGRLCNQIFAISSSYGLAKKSGREFRLPKWKYQPYFEWSGEIKEGWFPWVVGTIEPYFHYSDRYFDPIINGNQDIISIEGYLQTERYFKEYEKDIRAIFKWDTTFKNTLLSQMEEAFSKPTIGIHVRRGDYIGNKNYHNLPVLYYILALEEYFPNWTTEYNILIFSDDIYWCKTHLNGNNVYFSEGRNEIEDLCLLSQCSNFVLSNSSYSWWAAWLSNTNGRIIRPTQLFEGDLKRQHNIKDFWPSEWAAFDYTGKKLSLKDVVFTIPVHYDHLDRHLNLGRVVKLLNKNFDTNIIVGEQGGEHFKHTHGLYTYTQFQGMRTFHRTKMLNDMALSCSSPIIVNYDADVIVSPMQIMQAVYICRNNIAGMVFPYDGRFVRIPKHLQTLDFSQLQPNKLLGSRPSDPASLGGCVIFRRTEFIRIGMENENFISYGPEDVERVDRARKLGVIIQRVKGALYHYDHYTGPTSTPSNPYFQRNCEELHKISTMLPLPLQEYVNSWPWIIKIKPEDRNPPAIS